MRRPLLCCVLLFAVGCGAPERLENGVKDVYVESQRVDAAIHRVPYPLDPQSEGRAFAAVRDFATGRGEGRLKLGQLLGQYPASPATSNSEAGGEATGSSQGDPGSDPEAFELDLSEFPARNPPAILIFPDLTDSRVDSVSYLGHTAYLRPVYAPGNQFVHHLRLLVVNRHPRALRVPLDKVTLEVAALVGDGTGAVAGTHRKRVAMAGADGGQLDVLVVPPRAARLAHVFFFDDRLPAGILVRWEITLDPDPDTPDQGHEGWPFSATLVRRFVLEEGRITDLESRVAYGEPLIASRERLEEWLEPQMVPVPGGGMGDSGGDMGGAGQ